MHVMSGAYVVTLGVTILASVALCLTGRRRPDGAWIVLANRVLALALLTVSVEWVWTTGFDNDWSPSVALPLALCDVATLVAAAALWWRVRLLVELTWFWGLAGSLQSLITPDVHVGFPSAEFVEYVVAHAGIAAAALFLVVGQGLAPRRRAAPRVLAITAVYTAFVGLIDGVTGGNYMYLRAKPSSTTLLSALGPWPWYVFSAVGVAVVLLTLLDVPFWAGRRHRSGRQHRPVEVASFHPTGAGP